jgi:hypothetical protein
MMFTRGVVRRAVWPALATLLVAGAIAGCGRNQGELPAGFVPDGQPSSTTFMVSEFGYGINPEGEMAPGVLLTVIDEGPADAYNLYRRSSQDDSFHEVNTFPAPPTGSFRSGYGSFQAIDFNFQPNVGVEYIARSVIGGKESKLSTLSSSTFLPAGSEADLVPDLLTMLAPVTPPDEDPVKTDSIPTFEWQAVPGAQRYYLQVIRSDGKPFALVVTPPDASTSYTLQSNQGLVLQEVILTRAPYFWGVLALDANGFTVGAVDEFQIFEVDPGMPEE